MAEDDVKLRALAEGATPGPWYPVAGGYTFNPSVATRDEEAISLDSREWVAESTPVEHGGRENAAYIAAANPTAVLALLDRVEAAEAAVERVRALEPTWHRGMYGCPDDMFSRRNLRAALDGPR